MCSCATAITVIKRDVAEYVTLAKYEQVRYVY